MHTKIRNCRHYCLKRRKRLASVKHEQIILYFLNSVIKVYHLQTQYIIKNKSQIKLFFNILINKTELKKTK